MPPPLDAPVGLDAGLPPPDAPGGLMTGDPLAGGFETAMTTHLPLTSCRSKLHEVHELMLGLEQVRQVA